MQNLKKLISTSPVPLQLRLEDKYEDEPEEKPEKVKEPVEEIQVPNEEELFGLCLTKLVFRAMQSGIKLPVKPTKEEHIELIMEYGAAT